MASSDLTESVLDAQQDARDDVTTQNTEPLSEHIRALQSASWGASVPILYSGCMRMWPVLALEIAISLSIYWLITKIGFSLRNFLDVMGSFRVLMFLTLLASMLVLFFKVFRGKQIAWKARHWDNYDQFVLVQKRWDIAGCIVWTLLLVPGISVALVIGFTVLSLNNPSLPAPTTYPLNFVGPN